MGEHTFISYSRDDKEYVDMFASWLKGHGVEVWYDHYIDYGIKWQSEILDKLDSSSVVLVIMSASAKKSKWVDKEIKRAKIKRKSIYSLLLDKDGILYSLADYQLENVIGKKIPRLEFCQKIPGFLTSEMDIANSFNVNQKKIAQRIISTARGGWKKGDKGPGIAALQTELTRVGLDPGPINGIYREKMYDALCEFQKRRGIKPTVDGMIGPLTWTILINSSFGDLSPISNDE